MHDTASARNGSALEIELKLLASPDVLSAIAEGPLVRQFASGPPERLPLVSAYFDTPDFALRSAGYTLRVRWDGACWLQHLKVRKRATGGLFRRQEWEHVVKSGAPELAVLPSGPAFEAIRQSFHRLQTVFVTRFKRTTFPVTFRPPADLGPTTLTVSLDVGSIVTPTQNAPLSEVELELVAGPELGLVAFARLLRAAYPLRPGSRSKAERGYALLKAPAPPGVA